MNPPRAEARAFNEPCLAYGVWADWRGSPAIDEPIIFSERSFMIGTGR